MAGHPQKQVVEIPKSRTAGLCIWGLYFVAGLAMHVQQCELGEWVCVLCSCSVELREMVYIYYIDNCDISYIHKQEF